MSFWDFHKPPSLSIPRNSPSTSSLSSTSSTSTFSISKSTNENINYEFILEFGQFICRKIAFSKELDFTPLYPNQRARICYQSQHVAVVFQGCIIKTIVFNDNSYTDVFINALNTIVLPFSYSKDRLRNLILTIADYVTLYDVPIDKPFPLWLLDSYTPLINTYENFNLPQEPQTTSGKPGPTSPELTLEQFKKYVDYITKFTKFSAVDKNIYSFNETKLKFPTKLKNDSEKLYWLYIMTLGGVFDYKEKNCEFIPSNFKTYIEKSYIAAKKKYKIIKYVNIYPQVHNISVITNDVFYFTNILPWRTCFEYSSLYTQDPNQIIISADSGRITLDLNFAKHGGLSPELLQLYQPQPQYIPLLNHFQNKESLLLPVCIPNYFKDRYDIIYTQNLPPDYPLSFQLQKRTHYINARDLISQKKDFGENRSFLDILCPLEGDLFFKPLGTCSVYNNLNYINSFPLWYSIQRPPPLLQFLQNPPNQ